MMLYTVSASPEEIDIRCDRLIENHLVLKDTDGAHFVS